MKLSRRATRDCIAIRLSPKETGVIAVDDAGGAKDSHNCAMLIVWQTSKVNRFSKPRSGGLASHWTSRRLIAVHYEKR